MGEVAGGGTRRRKKRGEGTEDSSGQIGGEGNAGQSVPEVTGASVQPLRVCGLGEHKETLQTLVSPCPLLGAVRILFTLYQAGALRGWARRHPPSS